MSDTPTPTASTIERVSFIRIRELKGRIVRIHSLQSAGGKLLNDRRAAVLSFDEQSQRFEVKLEIDNDPDQINITKSVKESNLRLEPRLPLPDATCMQRGVATTFDEHTSRTLAQLLLWYRGSYRVPETMLTGFASMAFAAMNEMNFMYFVAVQMEQMGGVLMLAKICVQGEEEGTSDVLFALLEGDTMYLETLAQTIYWTGYIGPEDENQDANSFSDCPPTSLTPDQTKHAYIRTLSEGPLLLLQEMTRYKLGMALFEALRQCQFYHLLVRRLLRIVAREAQETKDGVKLGRLARVILGKGILARGSLLQPVSVETAENILENAESLTLTFRAVSNEEVATLLGISMVE
jgi:hypothetical protein